MLRKDNRYERAHDVRFHLYEMSKIGKSEETEHRLVVAKGWGKEVWRVTTNSVEFLFGGNENVLQLDSGNGCTTWQNHQTVPCKGVNFIVYEL